MMGLDFGRQLPVFGAFEKPPQLMQIASHEVVVHLDTSGQVFTYALTRTALLLRLRTWKRIVNR